MPPVKSKFGVVIANHFHRFPLRPEPSHCPCLGLTYQMRTTLSPDSFLPFSQSVRQSSVVSQSRKVSLLS